MDIEPTSEEIQMNLKGSKGLTKCSTVWNMLSRLDVVSVRLAMQRRPMFRPVGYLSSTAQYSGCYQQLADARQSICCAKDGHQLGGARRWG